MNSSGSYCKEFKKPELFQEFMRRLYSLYLFRRINSFVWNNMLIKFNFTQPKNILTVLRQKVNLAHNHSAFRDKMNVILCEHNFV